MSKPTGRSVIAGRRVSPDIGVMTGGDALGALLDAWRADIDHGLQDAVMTIDRLLRAAADAGVTIDALEAAGIIRPCCRQVIDDGR